MRRTAIKDVAAYCGFLVGFIGSAPVAWQQLAAQLEAGNFSRGLWYFLLVVSSAGVFAGVVGLGIGFLAGWTWEQAHRQRRNRRLAMGTTHGDPPLTEQPRLRLVPMNRTPHAQVVGSRLSSVRFSDKSVVFDFSGVALVAEDLPSVLIDGERFNYPEAGSRDAFCRLIGATASRMTIAENNDVALTLDDGSELALRTRVPPRP